MIVGILLAAGRSRRFGSNKLLHALPDGTPMIVRSLHTLRSAVPDTRVVVSPNEPGITLCLQDLGIDGIVCNNADSGMGASLACGVRASADADAWLVALADMPFLKQQALRKVADRLAAGAPLVAAACNGRRGHPVGFGREFGPALMQLAGDIGARELLTRHPHQLELVDSADPGVLRDIDYPDDFRALADNHIVR